MLEAVPPTDSEHQGQGLTAHPGAAQTLPTQASPGSQEVLFCSFKRCVSQSINVSQSSSPLSLSFTLKQETNS